MKQVDRVRSRGLLSLRSFLAASVLLGTAPGWLAAQAGDYALGVGVVDERGSSVGSLVVSFPFHSIASRDVRWGFGPVLGVGVVSDAAKRREMPFLDVALRATRIIVARRLGRFAERLAVGVTGEAGVAYAAPYDTSSMETFGYVFRDVTWIPTVRLGVTGLVGLPGGVPAALTYELGRVFRLGDNGTAVGLRDRWYVTMGMEVSTR